MLREEYLQAGTPEAEDPRAAQKKGHVSTKFKSKRRIWRTNQVLDPKATMRVVMSVDQLNTDSL